MSDPTAAPAAGDPAAQTATTTAAPAVEAPAPAPAPAAAATTIAAPAAPSTLLTAEDAPADPAATTEGQPAAEGEGEKKPDAKDDADAHAPEEYAAFELPEGATLDEEFVTAFKPIAKELDLPQGKANKLAAFAAQEHQRAGAKFVSELQRTVDDNAKAWVAAVKADPELGGAHHAEVMGTAKKALTTFATPALRQFLDESRLGSNPEMVRLLFKVGKAISQDSADTGRAAVASKSDAEVFYGTKA